MRLIDADKMIEHLDLCLKDGDSFTPIVDATLTAIRCYVEDAPTIDAAPVRHGEWKKKEVFPSFCVEEMQSAQCGVCGLIHTTPYLYFFTDDKYCPNCGAKMDGGEEE